MSREVSTSCREKRYDRQFELAAARLASSREMSIKGIAEGLEVPDNALRRWASEYDEDGESAFPGTGPHRVNKDFEIAKLSKENEELRKEVDFLKGYGPT